MKPTKYWTPDLSFIAGALISYLQGVSSDAWKQRHEIAVYISKCMEAGFCKTETDIRLCAERYLAGKRKVTPPGTKRRKRLVKEQELLRSTIPFELRVVVQRVIGDNEKAIQQFKGGNDKAINALIGQVMRQYKADAVVIKELLIAAIE